jgi:hypothetical protein
MLGMSAFTAGDAGVGHRYPAADGDAGACAVLPQLTPFNSFQQARLPKKPHPEKRA